MMVSVAMSFISRSEIWRLSCAERHGSAKEYYGLSMSDCKPDVCRNHDDGKGMVKRNTAYYHKEVTTAASAGAFILLHYSMIGVWRMNDSVMEDIFERLRLMSGWTVCSKGTQRTAKRGKP